MNNERTERMVDILAEEWDNYVVLASRVENGQTMIFHRMVGNTLANERHIDVFLDELFDGGNGDDYGE